MAYTKTNWNESTPITADKLNKIEDGIASALPLTGGTLSGNIVLNNDKAIGGKNTSGTVKWLTWIDKSNSANFGDTGLKSVINSNVNPEIHIGGQGVYTLYHTGNKPTAAEVGALPLTGGTLTGDTTFNQFLKLNAWPNYGTGTANLWYDANNKVIRVENATKLTLNGTSVSKEGHTHNNYLPLTGGTLSGAVLLDNNMGIGSKDTSGNIKWLAWVDKSNITNFGDGTLKSVINSSINPEVKISGQGVYTLYHTGNKPTVAEIGAAPASHTHNYLPLTGGTVSGETVFTNYLSVKAWPNYGTGNAQLWYDGNNKLLNIQNATGIKAGNYRVATWEGSNPTHHMFRYGSGLGGANGYITFSY